MNKDLAEIQKEITHSFEQNKDFTYPTKEELSRDINKNPAYKHAIKLLTIKDFSRHKLTEKLKAKEFSAEEIEEALREVLDRNYLREDLYAEARVKAFIKKGWSPNYIIQKLHQEHVIIDELFIEKIYEYLDLSQNKQLQNLVRKKCSQYSSSELESKRPRIIRYLMSKGHHYQEITKELENYLQTN